MSHAEFKTIAAVATPPGYGGIGIIRISGKQSLQLTRQLLHQGKSLQFFPKLVTLQKLIHPASGQLIDEALVTFFQAPHSFTGEDVVELSCHGSPVVLSEVLRLLFNLGVEPAEPGEFTLRAFLNQRLDLTQAESIHDLIHAQTTYQAQLAARQLQGELSRQLQPLKTALVELIVWFESAVEFVEDDLDALDLAHFQRKLQFVIERIRRLISTYRLGRLVHLGAKLALIGRPNVGKSSLFNALLGRERAIVSPIPGTTRDTVSEMLSIKGIPLRLIDTAGLRETDDPIERLGVERTRAAIADADLVVAVFSATDALSEGELAFMRELPIDICVINKCDLDFTWPVESLSGLLNDLPVQRLSALTGDGLDAFREALYQRLTASAVSYPEDAIITNERHFAALEQALDSLQQAEQDLARGFTEEIALANLHQALRQLGVITGETLIGEILNQIFSSFCIGK
jgi:tRNA modification GTPase